MQNKFTVYTILWAESADSVKLTIYIWNINIISVLSKKYNSYADIFSEKNADLLSVYRLYNWKRAVI